MCHIWVCDSNWCQIANSSLTTQTKKTTAARFHHHGDDVAGTHDWSGHASPSKAWHRCTEFAKAGPWPLLNKKLAGHVKHDTPATQKHVQALPRSLPNHRKRSDHMPATHCSVQALSPPQASYATKHPRTAAKKNKTKLFKLESQLGTKHAKSRDRLEAPPHSAQTLRTANQRQN